MFNQLLQVICFLKCRSRSIQLLHAAAEDATSLPDNPLSTRTAAYSIVSNGQILLAANIMHRMDQPILSRALKI
jgi:hypothetical protein